MFNAYSVTSAAKQFAGVRTPFLLPPNAAATVTPPLRPGCRLFTNRPPSRQAGRRGACCRQAREVRHTRQVKRHCSGSEGICPACCNSTKYLPPETSLQMRRPRQRRRHDHEHSYAKPQAVGSVMNTMLPRTREHTTLVAVTCRRRGYVTAIRSPLNAT